MKAIILAAGTGSRLGNITTHKTKGMVPVNGKPLIDYILNFVDDVIFDEVIVVGGFCYEELQEHIAELNYAKVRVIQNPDYLKGNIYTLITALKEFSGESFLITNVDHVYPKIMFEKMKLNFSGITAMCDFDRNLGADDMKVKLNTLQKITGIDKKLCEFDCGYIGMSFIDQQYEKEYRTAIDEAIDKFGEKAVVENILQILAEKDDNKPNICDLSGFGWYEIDTPDELKIAEKNLLTDKNFQ